MGMVETGEGGGGEGGSHSRVKREGGRGGRQTLTNAMPDICCHRTVVANTE